MRGYGRNPPDPRWPGDAKVCVQFVLNYEEGGENNILHGDPHSEAFLSEIIGATNWPGQRHWNMESIYEYGARAGFWRLWRLFTSRRVPVTVYGVASALARSPEQVVGHAGGAVGDRQPRPQMGGVQGRTRRNSSASISPRRSGCIARSRGSVPTASISAAAR